MVHHVHERQQQVREETAFLDPAAIASRWRERILPETLRQSGNRAVTNKTSRIRFVFLVIANTCAIGCGCQACVVLGQTERGMPVPP